MFHPPRGRRTAPPSMGGSMNEYELERGPGGAETRTYFVIGESRTNADNAITTI